MHLNDRYLLSTYGKWGEYYIYAKEYYNKNKNLLIPKDYKVDNTISLGNWIQKQRNRMHSDDEKLKEEQISLLNEIGMIWSINEWRWLNNYELARKYYQEYNHLKIPYGYEVDGIFLGKWLHTQRKAYKNQGCCKITEEHIQMLNEIGMIWEVFGNAWENNYELLLEFYKENGHANIPSSYVTKNGEKLGLWIWQQRKDYKNGALSKEKIKLLNKANMVWSNSTKNWFDNYEIAKKFFKENGHLLVKQTYKVGDVSLGNWINQQRQTRKRSSNALSNEQIKLLDDINMIWDVSNKSWYGFYQQLETLYQNNLFHMEDLSTLNEDLSKWVRIQQDLLFYDKLSETKVAQLKKIGFGGKLR